MGSHTANQHLSHHEQPANHSAAHHPEEAHHRIPGAQTYGHTSANHNTALQTGHAVVNVNPGHSTAVFTRPQSPSRAVRHPGKQGSPEYAEIPDDAVYTDRQLLVMNRAPIPRQNGDYEKPVTRSMYDAHVSDPNVGESPPNIKNDDYEELITAYTKLKRASSN